MTAMVVLEPMPTLLVVVVIRTMMSLEASPKGQPRHRTFLPKGMVTASSPLTEASRRRPTIHEGSIYVDENIATQTPLGTATRLAVAEPRLGWRPWSAQCVEPESSAWAPWGSP